ncbi:MAG: VOC family protein [Planctomycetaceae bacterium]|nr:VOC family protein [Planctomycetaceae bacterium]
MAELDNLHHVAISVKDIAEAVDWYREKFRCEVTYQDETWAMLKFGNIEMALVLPDEHPPHIAFTSSQATGDPKLKTHRDGTRSYYTADCAGNVLELMDPTSL